MSLVLVLGNKFSSTKLSKGNNNRYSLQVTQFHC